MFDINNLTENEVRQAFRCSNSECDCHKGKHVHCALSETHKNNDANPSMSIDKKDGKVVSHCFTGCNQSDLFNAVLKKCREEYGDDSNSSSNKKAYTIESIKRFKSNGKPYLRHHIYEVDGGCYLKAIFSDGKSKKQALFYHSTDGKQWFSKRHFEPVLYNRKAIKEDVQVIFPEGEKDVDTLIVYGYAAVTTGGADDKLTPKMIQDLSGKIIFCIADNDKPGREYMRKIAKAVNDFCNVFMVDLPGYWHKAFDEIIPEKADITDFVEKCKSAQFDDATIKQHISIMMQQAIKYEEQAENVDADDAHNQKTQAETWESIIPLDEYILPEVDIYDILPAKWADFISNVAEVVQVDPLMPLSSLLCGFATALQRKVEVDLGTHTEQLSLYALNIAERGERKSAVDKIMTQPLLDYAEKFNEAIKDALAKIRAERKKDEKRLEYLYREMARLEDDKDKKRLREYQEEAKGLELYLINNPEPFELMLISDNATVEKLGLRMSQNDERMAIFSSEAGILKDIASPNKEVNIDLYLKGYSGDNSDTDRITRDRVHMRKPALTINLMVQPTIIKEIIKNPNLEGRGFLDRPAYISCKSMIGERLRQKKTIDINLEKMYKDSLCDILDDLEYSDTKLKTPHLLKLKKDAGALWDDYYNAVESSLKNELLDILNYGSKVPGKAARLAGIIHFMKHGINGTKEQIDIDTMRRACNLNTLFVEHVRKIFKTFNAPGLEVAQKILSIITEHGLKEFSHRDIAHKSTLKLKDAQLPGLNLLIEHNYIKKTPTGFIVNPELLKTSNFGNKAE